MICTCEKCRFVELGEVTWGEEKIFDKDVEYIHKDLLLEWLNEMKANPMIPINLDKIIEYIKSL